MVNLYQFTVTTHTKRKVGGGKVKLCFPKESAHAQTGKKKKYLANETVEIKFYFKLPFYNYCQSYVYTHKH